MGRILSNIEPQAVWSHFEALNAVPRPSKKEEKVIQFIKDFGKSLNLEVLSDAVGNVVIKKPATAGMEDRKTVILQSHLDMVHQKNNGTVFDFDKEGIRMIVKGDWIHADGTTLGADNGLGVASAMALLSSSDIPHPALEALFTIDEETGMTGAAELDGSMLTGEILLNLDTEDDDELTVGCAGGIDITGTGSYATMTPAKDFQSFQISIKGLSGGHSGMDIDKGLGNANKLMNRLLYQLDKHIDIQIASINGGGLRNAIPRESTADVCINPSDQGAFDAIVGKTRDTLTAEHLTTDPSFTLFVTDISTPDEVMDPIFQTRFLQTVYALPNGIYRMSPDIKGLVQTSNNVSRIQVDDGRYRIACLTRSSADTEKDDLSDAIESTLSLLGAKVTMDGEYPGWTPDPSSDILKIMEPLYVEMFDEQPKVKACHAGLECGILLRHLPKVDMISFGPNIRGAHSPDERAQISSTQKYWKYLLETLQRIPKRS